MPVGKTTVKRLEQKSGINVPGILSEDFCIWGFRAFGTSHCFYTHSGFCLVSQGSPGSKGPRGDRGEPGKAVSRPLLGFKR